MKNTESTIPLAWETDQGAYVIWGTHDAEFGAEELIRELARQGYEPFDSPADFKYNFLHGVQYRWTSNTPQDETWIHPTYAYGDRHPGTVAYMIWSP